MHESLPGCPGNTGHDGSMDKNQRGIHGSGKYTGPVPNASVMDFLMPYYWLPFAVDAVKEFFTCLYKAYRKTTSELDPIYLQGTRSP